MRIYFFFFLAEILSNLHNSSSDVSCVSEINSVYERIRLEKLTFAHRAVSVSTDPSGCNFAILQSDPKTRYTYIYLISFLEGTVTGFSFIFSSFWSKFNWKTIAKSYRLFRYIMLPGKLKGGICCTGMTSVPFSL